MKKRFYVIHKLTQKPVRSLLEPYKTLSFVLKREAQALADYKNKLMGADFYTVIEKMEEV